MSHGFFELGLESIVVINPIIDGHLSTAHELVEDGPGAWRQCLLICAKPPGASRDGIRVWYRPDVSLRGQRGINHIDVVRLESHVPPTRTYISDHQGRAGGELALNIKIPLHHIISPGVKLHDVVAAALAVLRLAVSAR